MWDNFLESTSEDKIINNTAGDNIGFSTPEIVFLTEPNNLEAVKKWDGT